MKNLIFSGHAGQNRSPPSDSGPEGFQEKQCTSSHCPSFISPVPALVEEEFKDPVFCRRVAGLERMLRVRARTENTSGVGHSPALGKRDLATDSQVQGVASGQCFVKRSACEVSPVDTDSVAASLHQVPTNLPDPVLQSVSGDFEFNEPNILPDPVLETVSGDFEFKRDLEDGIVAVRASTAGKRNRS